VSASDERTAPTARIDEDDLAAIVARAARAGIAPGLLALGLHATSAAPPGPSPTGD
jgi:hypothetical protein